ncbi:MAG TPA: TonB-dependent receptor [Spirochaetia bacterium]|nr:TonB-dependent receptor [Spirochaetia bacterium]
MKRTLFAAAAVIQALSLWGQPSSPSGELPEIDVTATRIVSPVLESPAFVTVIGPQQIANSPAKDLAGLLAMQSGVTVNDNGPVGAQQSVSIRGSTAAQVLILVDGVRQNTAFSGGVDLSQIPLDMIDHIEVVRGGESAVYGADAVGGVINIITRHAEKPTASLKVENGSYLPHVASTVSPSMQQTRVLPDAADLADTQRLALSLSGAAGPLGLEGGGGFTRAANGYTWDDTAGIGGYRKESNADLTAGNGYLGLETPFAGGVLSAKGNATYSTYGVPGSLGLPTSNARQQATTVSTNADFKTDRFLVDPLSLHLTGFYRFGRLHYTDPDSYGGPTDSIHTSNTAGGELTQSMVFSDIFTAVFGGDFQYDAIQSTDVGSHTRAGLAGFAAFPVTLSNALTMTPSIRYDYFSDFAGGISYRLGVVYATGDTTSFKASIGESYRVPTFSDMYWNDAYYTGNPGVRPETAYSGDLGYSIRSDTVTFDAALFGRYLFDQIMSVPTSNPYVWTVQNVGRSIVPGFELHSVWKLTPAVTLGVDYTFMYSLVLADPSGTYSIENDLRVPFTPIHALSSSVTWTNGATRISADMSYVGKEYADPANTESSALAPYVVFNLAFRQNLTRHLTLVITGRNLLNEVYSTEPYGYVMPPFSIWTGFELRL